MRGFFRWLAVVLGGLLLGAGLTMHGQIALARYMRDEVENTFVVWRMLGKATFYLQGEQTQMALAMSEVPTEALDKCDRVAWVLVAIGVLVAVCGSFGCRSSIGAKKPRPVSSRG